MLARVYLHLPFKIIVAANMPLPPLSKTEDEIQCTIYSPQQFGRLMGFEVAFQNPPQPSKAVTYNNEPTYEMDVLVVELRAKQLDRTDATEDIKNPTLILAYKVVNKFLDHLRAITHDPSIRPIDGGSTIVFFEDDGQLVASQKGKIICSLQPKNPISLRNPVIDQFVWGELQKTEAALLPHQNLMLDAHSIFPELSSITLAFTAVESAAKLLIRNLSEKVSPSSMGEWLQSNRFREPRVEALLRGAIAGLSGIHLNQEQDFWDSFQALLKARNEIVHEGYPLKDGVRRLNRSELSVILQGADRVVRRLEDLGGIKRPGYSRPEKITIGTTINPFTDNLSVKLE